MSLPNSPPPGLTLRCGRHQLDLSRPKVMAILNITPDSFYDGGQVFAQGRPAMDRILRRAEAQIAQGADVLDVGGESTRPGATPVEAQEEEARVVPVVEALTQRFDVPVSVDTSTADVMRSAASAGAGFINDVRALQREGALDAAVATGLPVCLMHMQGSPESMQHHPLYQNAVEEVFAFLRSRVECCVAAGLDETQILVDPGIGFGKSVEHNLALLRNVAQFSALAPVLLGVSRKSLFERLLGRAPEERLAGSLAVAVMGLQQGVKVLRVHDVAETRDVVAIWQALAHT